MANDSTSAVFSETIQNIFHKDSENKAQQGQKKKRTQAQKRELELALTVLLVDLASCDQEFDMNEYNVICQGLMRVFRTTKGEVRSLVNQAKSTLANLRGIDNFAKLLNENLSHEDKIQVMEVIDDVIHADGVEDGFETYLRAKFASLLGMNEVQAA